MQAVDKLHASPWSDADLERRSRIRLYQRMNRVLCGNLQWDLENAMG